MVFFSFFPSQVCVRLRSIAFPFLQLHVILSITLSGTESGGWRSTLSTCLLTTMGYEDAVQFQAFFSAQSNNTATYDQINFPHILFL